mmetsp:Transcript_4594/g.13024  ORF Transcript_4594/g.13024 Transcript_4594/m.13024 type:complete len:279 (+) Transcript_4594:484-1320(+)
MILRMEMYLDLSWSFSRACGDTIRFFGCSRRRMTSRTVVFRTTDPYAASVAASSVRGVYPAIKKWHCGTGMSEASSPIRSLFIYPGYRSVAVDAAMTVATSVFVCAMDGLSMCNLSAAIRFKAVLSRTTTASALRVSRFIVSTELYGCTTTSDDSDWLGNTEYVWMSFFGYRSLSASRMNDPIPDPVPPAIECASVKPSRLSEYPASRSIMSSISSRTCSPWWYPLAQLFPAPPPLGDTKTFSGLNRCRISEFWMPLITRGSRSNRHARGMYRSSSAW